MKRPITVVTGFLGSGKTTLLSRLLEEPTLNNTAVLVNEFGEVGLDHHLLRRVEERAVLLGSGCVCCSTREDLITALLDLLDLDEKGDVPALERVVIETTGLADPAPIAYTIFTDPILQHRFAVDRVITTVDAVNGDLHLDRNPESFKQVAAADVVVVTKTDIGKSAGVRKLTSRLRAINPSAQVVETAFGEVDARLFFDSSKPVSEIAVKESWVEPITEPHDTAETHSVSLTFDGPIDWTAFGIWLSMLLHARGEDVLRVKGMLDVGEAGPVLLNGVQHIIHPPEHLEGWPDEDHRSRVIFITKRIASDEILASLRAFRGILGAEARPLGLERAPFPSP